MKEHAARSTLFDYKVTLEGLSVSSCATVKYLGVIIDSFEARLDNITKESLFNLRNITGCRKTSSCSLVH